MNRSAYIGNELDLFARAVNWKRYYGRHIKPFLGRNVLEVGAGIGETTRHLNLKAGRSWLCLEPDPDFCRIIQSKINSRELPGGCSVMQGTIESLMKKDMVFDTILYIDVLEHVADDQKELNLASALLENKGVLIILAPAHISLFNPFDTRVGHYRRYNRKQLEKALPGAIKTEVLMYLDCMGIFPLLINRWLGRRSLPSEIQIEIWDRILIPISRIVDPFLFRKLGKTLLAVLRKDDSREQSL